MTSTITLKVRKNGSPHSFPSAYNMAPYPATVRVKCHMSLYGEESIPPCSLPYLFFSLYQNHLSDTEQMDIISDALHHTGQTSLIHLQGIKDINEIVQLRLKKNLSSYATYFSACRLLHNQQRAYSPKAKAARILCF